MPAVKIFIVCHYQKKTCSFLFLVFIINRYWLFLHLLRGSFQNVFAICPIWCSVSLDFFQTSQPLFVLILLLQCSFPFYSWFPRIAIGHLLAFFFSYISVLSFFFLFVFILGNIYWSIFMFRDSFFHCVPGSLSGDFTVISVVDMSSSCILFCLWREPVLPSISAAAGFPKLQGQESLLPFNQQPKAYFPP